MKKLSFLIIGLIITSFIYSQDYYPFPDSNAIWNEYSIHVENPQNVAYKIRYGIIGDTVIDTKIYSKIYMLINDTCLNINNAEYFGAIREENKQIFTIITYHGDQEILLYDFSKGIGDTICSNSPEGYMANPVIITNIDTVELYDGSNRKRYWFEDCYFSFIDECWIEGFGSIHGLFAPIFEIILNYYEPNLSCFKQNGYTVYLNNYSCDKCFCSLETSIKVISESKDFIRTYPNPVKTNLFVDSNVEKYYYQLIFYDSKGNMIKNRMIHSFPIELDVRDLPIGIYLIQLTNGKSTYSKKFIKSE